MYLEISRVIISFATENQALQYIKDGINHIITHYDDKAPYIYHENEMSSNIELLNLLNTIITKLQRLKESSEPSEDTTINSTEKTL